MSSGEDRSCSSRLLTKLNDAMDSKKFYEAHQLMRVINFRYTSAKKFAELEILLGKTAITLLETEQFESGSDVAIMLTKLYIDNCLPVNPDRIEQTSILVQKMHTSPERQAFITNVIEWCGSSNVHLSGAFNSAVAQIYIKERNFTEAWKHLIRMCNSKEMADYTYKIIEVQQIPNSEHDLVISNLVLSLLAGRRVMLAGDVYEEVLKKYSGQTTPLLNGVRFMLEAAKKNNPQTFKSIKQIYWPSFNRDSNICRLVETVGKTVFKFPDSNQRNGFMANIFNALLSRDSPGDGSSSGGGDSQGHRRNNTRQNNSITNNVIGTTDDQMTLD